MISVTVPFLRKHFPYITIYYNGQLNGNPCILMRIVWVGLPVFTFRGRVLCSDWCLKWLLRFSSAATGAPDQRCAAVTSSCDYYCPNNITVFSHLSAAALLETKKLKQGCFKPGNELKYSSVCNHSCFSVCSDLSWGLIVVKILHIVRPLALTLFRTVQSSYLYTV